MNPQANQTCIIYVRVSSKEQVEGTSLETQEEQCREYAQRNKITVLKVFVEGGQSAKTADRAAFMAAIDYCTKNKPTFFIVHKLDRFSRNAQVHLGVREILLKHGTSLRSVSETINETPEGEFMGGIHALVAQYDNAQRANRTKNGMIQRAKEGYWVWIPPLGYYKPLRGKRTHIVPDPIMAPIVRAGFEEYAKGEKTYKEMADFLTKQGLLTKRKKPILPQEVQKLLRNPAYCGVIKAFGEEWVGGFEPIIAPQLFRACQQPTGQRSSWSVPRETDNSMFPLRKLICCAECGSPLTGSNTRGWKGKRYPYYHHSNSACSKKKTIAKDKFESTFVKHLSTIAPDQKYEKLFKSVVMDIWKSNHRRFDKREAAVQQIIEKLKIERQQIFELHRNGKYSDEDFQEQRALNSKRLDVQYSLIEDNRKDDFDLQGAMDYCFKFIGQPAKTWMGLEGNHHARIRFQNLIFKERLTFDGNKFGTTALSPIFAIKTTFPEGRSLLVAPRGIEPLSAP